MTAPTRRTSSYAAHLSREVRRLHQGSPNRVFLRSGRPRTVTPLLPFLKAGEVSQFYYPNLRSVDDANR